MGCGVGHRRGLDPALLWLWRRLEPTAPIRLLAWEPPYVEGAALEKTKRQTNKQTVDLQCCAIFAEQSDSVIKIHTYTLFKYYFQSWSIPRD